MRVSELQVGPRDPIELVPDGAADLGVELHVGDEVRLALSSSGETLLSAAGRVGPVRGADRRAADRLAQLLAQGLPRITWVATAWPRSGPAQRVTLAVHVFPGELRWTDPTDVGIDDKLVEELRRRHPECRGPIEAAAYLAEQVLLPPEEPGEPPRALLTAGAQPTDPFRLHGARVSLIVSRGSDARLRVERVIGTARHRTEARGSVLLLRAPLRFCDATLAGPLRGAVKGDLDRMTARPDSYLMLWAEYNAIEREIAERRAQRLGVQRYTRRRALEDGRWRFELAPPPAEAGVAGADVADDAAALQRWLDDLSEEREPTLQATETPPALTLSVAEAERTDPARPRARRSKRADRPFSGEVVGRPGGRTLVLQARTEDRRPPKSGYLALDLSGDDRRLRRREEALRRIHDASGPMPQLGLLIEGQSGPPLRHRVVGPLTPAVRRALGGAPNPAQLRALEVALNTPDLALIQGPPGTGKTTVLTALQVRLAEMNEGQTLPGQTLLSSFQHEAVEHAARKSQVFGLPAIKIGGRRGQEADEARDDCERWRRGLLEALQADLSRLPEHPVTAAYLAVRARAARYRLAPAGLSEARAVLADVEDRARAHLPTALLDRVVRLRQALAPQPRAAEVAPGAEGGPRRARQAVEGLRVLAGSFADDGPLSAERALSRLRPLGLLTDDEAALLDRAAGCPAAAAPVELLDALAALRGALIDRLDRQRQEQQQGPPPALADVADLLGEVVTALHEAVRGSRAGEAAALSLYHDDLDQDPRGTREAVRQYTAVLAATCQQADSRGMAEARGEPPVNVIVDEAARASPLDLLIPMSKAQRRVVLVGDHRQLPHLLEPDLERRLAHSLPEVERAALSRSLFERLFRSLKDLAARGEAPRVVTLDVQYRMHPELARFVSRQFYEPHGEGFTSGDAEQEARLAAARAHEVGWYRAAARGVWKDVPHDAGAERGGQSKARPVEAAWIAAEVGRLLQERPDRSIGVISFYAAQVAEVRQRLLRAGIAERREDGAIVIAPEHRELRDGEGKLRERLCVGTVDAFQGKEFDVVLLSMTRSNQHRVPAAAEPAECEQARRRRYGHLMLPNRLCVAMSRQRRLLIVVGDAAMVGDAEGRAAVPALAAFHDLCGGEHGQRV